jgi:hypothetical protein
MPAVPQIATTAALDLNAVPADFDLTGTQTITSIALAEGEVRSGRAAGSFTINTGGPIVAVKPNDRLFFRGEAGGAARYWVFSAQVQGTQPWLPELRFNGGNTGLTHVTQKGSFSQLGNMVFLNGNIQLSNRGSSTGYARIINLPVAPRPEANFWWCGTIGLTTVPAARCMLRGAPIELNFYKSDGTILMHTDFTNSSEMIFSVAYETLA